MSMTHEQAVVEGYKAKAAAFLDCVPVQENRVSVVILATFLALLDDGVSTDEAWIMLYRGMTDIATIFRRA